MKVIPVIDLSEGRVVHARHGDRQHYQPIKSSLCEGCEPLDIVEALLELYPFDLMYIADLDAIQKRGDHCQVVNSIKARYPHLQIWLDAGISHVNDLDYLQLVDVTWVIGSESLRSIEDYLELQRQGGAQTVLSLDFDAGGYRGPVELLENPAIWPEKMIIMTLSHVGSGLGPDYQLLTKLLSQKTRKKIYAAGGVRNISDIQCLKTMGIGGVLVASALHDRRLTAAEIGEYSSV